MRAGEGRVVGVSKFHFWGKCTMPLTNINSDWTSNTSSGMCVNLFRGSILGCNDLYSHLFQYGVVYCCSLTMEALIKHNTEE